MKNLLKASAVVVTLYSSIIATAVLLPIPTPIKAGVAAFALCATAFSLNTKS
jgi:hypothetical protein